MFTQLYSPRYTQPIKAYNSVLNKIIHLFMVKDYLYHNIHISVSYIKRLTNEFGNVLTYSFDINTVSLKSSSLKLKLGYNVNRPFKLVIHWYLNWLYLLQYSKKWDSVSITFSSHIIYIVHNLLLHFVALLFRHECNLLFFYMSGYKVICSGFSPNPIHKRIMLLLWVGSMPSHGVYTLTPFSLS